MGREAANGRDGWAGTVALSGERWGEALAVALQSAQKWGGESLASGSSRHCCSGTTGRQPPAGWDLHVLLSTLAHVPSWLPCTFLQN